MRERGKKGEKHSIKDILNVIIKSNEHQMKFDTLNSVKNLMDSITNIMNL